MAHFAKVKSRKVIEVIVAEQDYIDSLPIEKGVKWVQTSYNTSGNIHYGWEEVTIQEYDEDDNPSSTYKTQQPYADGGVPLRKNYAGVGYTYDTGRDAFYAPKPFPSWTLNEDTCLWEPPTPMPDDDLMYEWDESKKEWVEIE
tara:strand:+ start:22300 stop:22728 length:429 start_codon:yes stop_codon:yes gene_type:complete